MTDPIELQSLQPMREVDLTPRNDGVNLGEGEKSFSDLLSQAIKGVDETMKESDQNIQNFVAGKTDNVHDVMISMQRAQTSFQMMVEVRNKAVEAYNEISRMQI